MNLYRVIGVLVLMLAAILSIAALALPLANRAAGDMPDLSIALWLALCALDFIGIGVVLLWEGRSDG